MQYERTIEVTVKIEVISKLSLKFIGNPYIGKTMCGTSIETTKPIAILVSVSISDMRLD
jgi:hypothetical protein